MEETFKGKEVKFQKGNLVLYFDKVLVAQHDEKFVKKRLISLKLILTKALQSRVVPNSFILIKVELPWKCLHFLNYFSAKIKKSHYTNYACE